METVGYMSDDNISSDDIKNNDDNDEVREEKK